MEDNFGMRERILWNQVEAYKHGYLEGKAGINGSYHPTMLEPAPNPEPTSPLKPPPDPTPDPEP